MNAEEMLDLGLTYQLKGELAKAEEYFNKALLKNPGLLGAYRGLGDIYLKTDRFNMAEEMYKKASEIQPDHGKGYLDLAKLYILRGDEKKALPNLKKALPLSSGDWRASKGLGYLCFLGNELEEAISWFKIALEGNEEDLAIHFWLALVYHQKGMQDERNKEMKRVRSICESIKKFLPSPSTVLFYILGKISLYEGKTKEAIQHLEGLREKIRIKNRRKLELGVFYDEIDILKTLASAYEKDNQKALLKTIRKEIVSLM